MLAKIFELSLSWHLTWVSNIFCNQLNFKEIPSFKHLLLVDIHVSCDSLPCWQ